MLPYGIYILEENVAPAGHHTGYFYLIVNEDGVYQGGQYGTRADAENAAALKNQELKNS